MVLGFLAFWAYSIAILAVGLGLHRLLRAWLPDVGQGMHSEIHPNIHTGFHLLFGQFAIGMLAVGMHFFLPLNHMLPLAGVFLLSALGARHLARISLADHLALLGGCLLAVPYVIGVDPGYDGGLYHIPHQLWLREEKVVFGLANLHGRFGFGSFQEYVWAVQWVGDRLNLVAFSGGVYFVAFFLFIIRWLGSRDGEILFLVLGLLATLAVFGRFGTTDVLFITGFTFIDNQAGLLVVLTFFHGYKVLRHAELQPAGPPPTGSRSGDDPANTHFILLLILLLFLGLLTILLKISTVPVLAWVGYVCLTLIRQGRISFARVSPAGLMVLGAMLVWLTKNVISTGCLLYPAVGTCLDLAWAAADNARIDAWWVTAWARHPHAGLSALDSWAWFQEWWMPTYGKQLLRYALVCAALSAVALGASLVYGLPVVFSRTRLAGLLFVLVGLAFWFINAPTPRFGSGVLLLFPPVLGLQFLGKTDAPLPRSSGRQWLRNTAVALLVAGALWGGWKHRHVAPFLAGLEAVHAPVPEVVEDQMYGVRPKLGDACWAAPRCAPASRPEPRTWRGYLMFPSTNGQDGG